MKFKQYFSKGLFLAVLGGLTTVACTDDIDLGFRVDEDPYEAVTRVDGMLLDAASNRNEALVELRSDKYEGEVFFRLTQMPRKGVDVKVELDPAYLETYNAEHGTEFKLFPADRVAIEGGELLLAPDDKRSVEVKVTLTGGEALEADATYVVPLAATTATEGITLSPKAQHMVYLVKDLRSLPTNDKGPDAIKTVLYFEVNDTNPLNALEFLTESGKLFFDEIVLFSANINYKAETGRVYVLNNPNVQFLLDNNETYLQPLRKRGMKVILGILGNHDAAGCAQLSTVGAQMFAQELAAYCYAYNLDGVGFDDEYSKYPDLSNPLFAEPSAEAAGRLLYESKRAMPDKTVMVYYLGNIYSNIPAVDGVLPSEFVDYAVADYALAADPMDGMTLKDCAGMSVELRRNKGDYSEDRARRIKADGYGYYMFFALDPSLYSSQVPKCQAACRGLYEEELVAPTHYYKKDDATRYAIGE